MLYDGGKPSAWAYILDTLARDLNVVIVVSAGNLPILGMFGKRTEQLVVNFPQYLLEKKSKIIDPAPAANVITVGALAHSETSHLMSRYPNDPAIKCIAGIDQPSPFTRSGPGVNEAIKPEVCEYGGNITWPGHGRILMQDPETSIISMNVKHLERLFTANVGTSFAAPKITHLAGLILKHYPDISANLVRALIVNAATPPVAVSPILNKDEILKLCGYGRPDRERALFSADHRVTLITEEEIALDTIHLYEIPLPNEFKQAKGKRRITVSLAFDPPVRHTRKDYLGLKISFRLLRGLSTKRIIQWYAKRSADIKPEQIPTRHICKMSPSPTRREGGTLQKAIFTARQNRVFTDYAGDVFHLLVRCQAGWASPEEFDHQNYALAVTIEHLDDSLQIYNVIKQRLQLAPRIRIRR